MLWGPIFHLHKLHWHPGPGRMIKFTQSSTSSTSFTLTNATQDVLCCKPRASRNSSQESFVASWQTCTIQPVATGWKNRRFGNGKGEQSNLSTSLVEDYEDLELIYIFIYTVFVDVHRSFSVSGKNTCSKRVTVPTCADVPVPLVD